MKLKTSAIILIVASGLVLLSFFFSTLNLFQLEYYYYGAPRFSSLSILIPIALLIFGISLFKKEKLNTSGIILVISSGIVLLSTIIDFGNIDFIDSLINFLIPIAVLTLGGSLISNKKNKTLGIILLFASGLFFISIFANFQMFQSNPFGKLIGFLIPISLLLLGISFLKKESDNYDLTEKSENLTKEEKYSNLSIGDWILIFLITIIPLIGLIFMCIWANDEKNKVRKNYAIATLIWWGITIIFAIFLFTEVLTSLSQGLFR